MNFIKGRDNLACTIFVPVICGNNCSFCNTKKDYDGFIYDEKYLTKIINHIKNLNKTHFVSEFVITGGEPFADLDILEKIVNACEKPVFINTSLPKTQKAYNIVKFINENQKVRGVNISRHIGLTHSVPVYGTEIIDMIEKPVRINCLVTEKNFQIHKINELLENYIDNNENRLLNLRADYRTINDSNLKSRDYIFNQLLNEYEYMGSNGCLACYTSFFKTQNGDKICYHRGIENSSVVTKDKIYVNDIIVDMYGNLYYDWNKPLEYNTEFRILFSPEESIVLEGDSLLANMIILANKASEKPKKYTRRKHNNVKKETPGEYWESTRCGGSSLSCSGYSDDVNGSVCGVYERNSCGGTSCGGPYYSGCGYSGCGYSGCGYSSGRSYYSGCGGSSCGYSGC
jgi:organic radical activating enzyme